MCQGHVLWRFLCNGGCIRIHSDHAFTKYLSLWTQAVEEEASRRNLSLSFRGARDHADKSLQVGRGSKEWLGGAAGVGTEGKGVLGWRVKHLVQRLLVANLYHVPGYTGVLNDARRLRLHSHRTIITVAHAFVHVRNPCACAYRYPLRRITRCSSTPRCPTWWPPPPPRRWPWASSCCAPTTPPTSSSSSSPTASCTGGAAGGGMAARAVADEVRQVELAQLPRVQMGRRGRGRDQRRGQGHPAHRRIGCGVVLNPLGHLSFNHCWSATECRTSKPVSRLPSHQRAFPPVTTRGVLPQARSTDGADAQRALDCCWLLTNACPHALPPQDTRGVFVAAAARAVLRAAPADVAAAAQPDVGGGHGALPGHRRAAAGDHR